MERTPAPCSVVVYCRDSHSKSLYRALACFLFDFWNQKECEASTNAAAVQQLYKLPMQPGQSKCFHLLGGGRVCVVYAVIGTSLTNNKQVMKPAAAVAAAHGGCGQASRVGRDEEKMQHASDMMSKYQTQRTVAVHVRYAVRPPFLSRVGTSCMHQ